MNLKASKILRNEEEKKKKLKYQMEQNRNDLRIEMI